MSVGDNLVGGSNIAKRHPVQDVAHKGPDVRPLGFAYEIPWLGPSTETITTRKMKQTSAERAATESNQPDFELICGI